MKTLLVRKHIVMHLTFIKIYLHDSAGYWNVFLEQMRIKWKKLP